MACREGEDQDEKEDKELTMARKDRWVGWAADEEGCGACRSADAREEDGVSREERSPSLVCRESERGEQSREATPCGRGSRVKGGGVRFGLVRPTVYCRFVFVSVCTLNLFASPDSRREHFFFLESGHGCFLKKKNTSKHGQK
jgi:hypothetical protein